MQRLGLSLMLLAGLALLTPARAGDSAPAPHLEYGEPRQLCDLEDPEVDESSGLAASRREPGLLWTHNDSGDGPRVYALDLAGRRRASVEIAGAQAVDWEDMASFTWKGRPYLLLADVGDNDHARDDCALYLVPEPTPGQTRVPLERKIPLRFAEGPYDCEAVGVDASDGTVLLVTKTRPKRGPARVYTFTLPATSPRTPLVLRATGKVDVPWVTALDISPDGRRAVLLTYKDAWLFERAEGATWADALGEPGRRIALPKRRQGEAVCFGQDGLTLFLTSEKLPAPLFEVAPRASARVRGESGGESGGESDPGKAPVGGLR